MTYIFKAIIHHAIFNKILEQIMCCCCCCFFKENITCLIFNYCGTFICNKFLLCLAQQSNQNLEPGENEKK